MEITQAEWEDYMRWKLQRRFVAGQPGARGTKANPSFDTSRVEKRELMMEKRRQSVNRPGPDGTLLFNINTPKGQTQVVGMLDQVDADLADDDIWRVLYASGYPYVVSRFCHTVCGSVKLSIIIAKRKYGEDADMGRITHRNGNAMDFTRSNVLNADERQRAKTAERIIKENLRARKRKLREERKALIVAEKRKENETRVSTWIQPAIKVTKPKQVKAYVPTNEEVVFDAWVGAYEPAPGRWRPMIKSPTNIKPFDPVRPGLTFATEKEALQQGVSLWLSYMDGTQYAPARAYAKLKAGLLDTKPNPLAVAFQKSLSEMPEVPLFNPDEDENEEEQS